MMNKKIYFITFITEGPPYDGGFNLTKVGEKIKKELDPFFTEIYLYTKRSIKELPGGEEICNEYPEPCENNSFHHLIGYCDYKSFLLKYHMDKLPEGSLILYHDGNFEKNPHYFDSDWENIYQICTDLLNENNSDVWLQIEREFTWVKEHVKRYTIDHIIENKTEQELALESRLLNSSKILVRNSELSKNFINDLFILQKNKDLVGKRTPDPNRHPQARYYCSEQDIINALVYKYIFDGKLIPEFPKYTFFDRVLRNEKIIGKDGIIRGGKKELVDPNIVNYINSNKTNIVIENRPSLSGEEFQKWWDKEFKIEL